MAVIDADAPVVETERTWESMGSLPHPPHAAHSMGALGKEPQRARLGKLPTISCESERVSMLSVELAHRGL